MIEFSRRQLLQGGLAGLLEREASPGITSPLGAARVQQQLQAGLKAGRWTSAAHVAAWLKEAHGITRSRKSSYDWFEKVGLRPADAASVTSAARERKAASRR